MVSYVISEVLWYEADDFTHYMKRVSINFQ